MRRIDAKTIELVIQVAPHTRFISVTSFVSVRRNAIPNRNITTSTLRSVTLWRISRELPKIVTAVISRMAPMIER